MALTTCPNCGASISDKAKTCPHCNFSVNLESPELTTIIVCEDCGFEIPDGFTECPNCGCPVNTSDPEPEIQKVEVASVNVPVKKKTKTIITVVACLLIIAAGVLISFFTIVLAIKYKKAQGLIDDKQYSLAVSEYESLGDYKNSEEKICECNYLWGVELFNAGEEDLALQKFNDSKGYQDANKYIEKLEASKKEADLKAKLKSAYSFCTYSRTHLSYDEKSITVDSKNEYDSEGVRDIAKIIVSLELPNSILESMYNTSALMGKQSTTSNGFKVEWTYHPDDGLDVIFSIEE